MIINPADKTKERLSDFEVFLGSIADCAFCHKGNYRNNMVNEIGRWYCHPCIELLNNMKTK